MLNASRVISHMSDSSCNSFKDSGPKIDMIIINDKMK